MNILKPLRLALPLLALLSLTGRASADIGVIEAQPGATLLLPYFEVDLSNAAGVTTLFSINNASATAVLAHVTLWTDLSVPTLAFNIYLTGYDVQTLNVRDILQLGTVPRTASAGQDPSNTISPKGAFSQDINFASCSGILPPPTLPASFIAHLQASHTGQFSAILNGCAGQNKGDNIARGYITVDTVNNCTLRYAGNAGYFVNGGAGDATNQNVLFGDYFFLNSALNLAEGDSLVHIQASATDPATSTAGRYTFYGRYDNWNAADNREPLVTNFAVRYVNGGVFNGGTNLLTWRDPKVDQHAFTCPVAPGVRPAWYPLVQEGIVTFDEQEHPFIVPPPPFYPPPPPSGAVPFPSAAERTAVGSANLPTPFNFGWMYLNLNTTVAAAGSNPSFDPAAAQAWVTSTHSANGRFSVGYAASQLDSATNASHFTPH